MRWPSSASGTASPPTSRTCLFRLTCRSQGTHPPARGKRARPPSPSPPRWVGNHPSQRQNYRHCCSLGLNLSVISMLFVNVEGFLEVARLGSVSRAAEVLDVTQPTLTARLHSLERDM